MWWETVVIVTYEFPASEENYKPQNASWPRTCQRCAVSGVPGRFEGESEDVSGSLGEAVSHWIVVSHSHSYRKPHLHAFALTPVLMMITHPTLFPCLFNF